MSKYAIGKAMDGNVVGAIAETVLPPIPFVGSLISDIPTLLDDSFGRTKGTLRELVSLKLGREIPLIGSPLYSQFKGKERWEEKETKRLRDELNY